MNLGQWFRGFRGKLLIIVATAILCTIALIGVNQYGTRRVDEAIDAITEIRMPSIRGLEAMNLGQATVTDIFTLLEYSAPNAQEADALIKSYHEARSNITTGFKLYEPLPQTPDESEEYNQVFLKAWPAWEAAADQYIEARKSGQSAHALFTKVTQASAPARASLEKIIGINYKNAEDDKALATSSSDRAQNLGLASGIGGGFAILILGFLLANQLARTLTGLAERLSQSSNQVANASSRVAASSQELSQSTTEQAASLEETAASLEEITSMITRAAEGADQAAASSTGSQTNAEDGRAAVNQMQDAMREISASNSAIMTQIDKSNAQMAEIVQVIEEIGQKTKVINEIVFQTKLLSFNASVEAARAGEHGKGFAVVAEEIGNLAQMSGAAAKQITELLEGSTTKVQGIIQSTRKEVQSLIDEGRGRVEAGSRVADRCASALDEIVSNVTKVSELARDISQAGKEQSQGVREINKAIGQLDTVTQHNASASETTATAAEMLSTEADTLKRAVEELSVVINGNAKAVAAKDLARADHSPIPKDPKVIPLAKRAPKSPAKGEESRDEAGKAGKPAYPDRNAAGFKDV